MTTRNEIVSSRRNEIVGSRRNEIVGRRRNEIVGSRQYELPNAFKALPLPGTFDTTIKEFCTRYNLEYSVGQGLFKFLVNQKFAKVVGLRKTGRGKPSEVYNIPATVSLCLGKAA